MHASQRPEWRQVLRHAGILAWILVKLTLVSALLSPGVKELIYAGF